MADGDYISKQLDIEYIFGRANVEQWGNPDNEEDYALVEQRINQANLYAESEFLGRIAEGPYDLEEVRTIKPQMAITICASLAGSWLYDTRRVVDSDPGTDEIGAQRKNANKWIQQIMAGQLKLIDPTTYVPLTKLAENSPRVVSE
jgi:hypothetical protein